MAIMPLKTNNMTDHIVDTNKKVTAVEWLFLQLYEKFEMKGDGREMSKVLEQAKEMEEKQSFTADELKAAYHAGYLDAKTNHINDAEQYVNARVYLKNK